MAILRLMFTVISFSGFWRPYSWTSGSKYVLYTIYTVFSWLSVYTVIIMQVLDLVLLVDNQSDFFENLRLTMESIASLWKMSTLLKNRKKFLNLLDTLNREPLAPVSTDEIAIRKKFDKFAEFNGIVFATAVACLLIAMFVTALMDDNPRRLAYRMWLPYNYSSPMVYTVTFVYAAVSISITSFMSVAGDTIFSGLLIHTNCLFDIFGHRLKKGVNEPEIYALKQCARLHNHIYKFAKMVNEEFKIIMMMQFLVSTLTLCSELYRLTQREVDSQYIEIVTYATCVVMQLLFFCWYGNEVRLKSLEVSDMIYESNWMSLDPDARKILLTIMIRSTSPIEFSSAQIFSMNLNSFMAIMKMAYSAYNMLHR